MIVSKLDRITRSTADLARLIERLRDARRADGGEGVWILSARPSTSGHFLPRVGPPGHQHARGTVAMWERESHQRKGVRGPGPEKGTGRGGRDHVPFGYSTGWPKTAS